MPIFLVLLISTIFVFSQFSEALGDHSYFERPIEHSNTTLEAILVDYLGYGAHIKKVQADYSEKKLMFDVYITETPAFLEIVLPRELLDSKDHAEDEDFKIIYDGNRAGYDEVETSASHRTLNISLRGVTASELIELEIFGSQIFDKHSQKKPKVTEEKEVENLKVKEIEIEEETEIKEVNLEQEVKEIEEEVTLTTPVTPATLVIATTPVTPTKSETNSVPIPFTNPDEKNNKNSSLWSDKSIYKDGSIVHIKGKIKDVSSQPIQFVKVYSPSNYIIESERVTVSDNGEFDIEFNTSDYLWYENGEHLIQTEDLNGHINQLKIKVIETSGEFNGATQEILLDSEIETHQENSEDTCFICKNKKLSEKLEKQVKQIDVLNEQVDYSMEIIDSFQGFFGSIFLSTDFF